MSFNEVVKTSAQFVEDFQKKQEENHKNPEANRGYPLPIKFLDTYIKGIHKGWITYVAGKMKAGKTSLLCTMGLHWAKLGLKGMYFALEESLEGTAARAISGISTIPRVKFRDVTLTPQDFVDLNAAVNEARKWNFMWVSGMYTIPQMNKIISVCEPDIVMVDHIHMMYSSQKKGFNRTNELDELSLQFTQMAHGDFHKGREMAVVVAAQENEDGRTLWSKGLERDADLLIHIDTIPDMNGDEIPGQRTLAITRFRWGEVGHEIVAFDGSHGRVADLDTVHSPEIRRPS